MFFGNVEMDLLISVHCAFISSDFFISIFEAEERLHKRRSLKCSFGTRDRIKTLQGRFHLVMMKKYRNWNCEGKTTKLTKRAID